MPPKKRTETIRGVAGEKVGEVEVPDDDATEHVTPAEAAAAEVQGKPVKVKFRGETYEVSQEAIREVTTSPHVAMAPYMGDFALPLFAALGQDQSARLLTTCKFGDNIQTVTNEFFEALGAAAGQGNS